MRRTSSSPPHAPALFFQNAQIVAARAARGAVSSYLVDFGGTPPVAEIGDHRFYDWRAGINLSSWRHHDAETAYPADAIGYAESGDDILPAELGSETLPESELPGGPASDEQQAMPTAFANAVASEPLDTQ